MLGRVVRLTIVLLAFLAGYIAAFVWGPKSRAQLNECPDPPASECTIYMAPAPTWIVATNGLITLGPGLIALALWWGWHRRRR